MHNRNIGVLSAHLPDGCVDSDKDEPAIASVGIGIGATVCTGIRLRANGARSTCVILSVAIGPAEHSRGFRVLCCQHNLLTCSEQDGHGVQGTSQCIITMLSWIIFTESSEMQATPALQSPLEDDTCKDNV